MPDPAQPYFVKDGHRFSDLGAVTAISKPAKQAKPPKKPSDVASHIRLWLGSDIQLPAMKDTVDVLSLPLQRRLTAALVQKINAEQPKLNPTAIFALSMYLTGDKAAKPCLSCQMSTSPFKRCIIISDAAPVGLTNSNKGACASCLFRNVRGKLRNGCSLISLPQQDGSVHADGEKDDNCTPSNLPQAEPPPPLVLPRPSRNLTEMSSEVAKVDPGVVIMAGQVIPATMLEMEDWEVAPGRIRDESGPNPESKCSPTPNT
jgi:hypothetical protein